MKIYTKTGDAGESGLIGGIRMRKDDRIFWAIGTIEELNSLLGASRSELSQIGKSELVELASAIDAVQNDLFGIGSELAALFSSAAAAESVTASRITDFEKQIDYWSGLLPELNAFISPGGSRAGAMLHQARTVCRRAERELVALGRTKQPRRELYCYLNRLGDWLFTAARYVNWFSGEAERILE